MAHREQLAKYPDLKNQVALVLGAGQSGNPKSKHWGNGAAIAKVLSTSGAKVIACDVNLDAAQQTASRIQASGGVCDAAQADVTSARDIQRVTDQVLTKYGGIDILVNNVGGTKPGGPAAMS